MSNHPTIILDTNFLLVPIRFRVDIFEETERVLNQLIKFAVTPSILKEIEYLKTKANPSFLRELVFVEKIIEKCTVLNEPIIDGENTDDSIIRIASSQGYYVGTSDKELRRKLREAGVRIVFLRQRRYLDVE